MCSFLNRIARARGTTVVLAGLVVALLVACLAAFRSYSLADASSPLDEGIAALEAEMSRVEEDIARLRSELEAGTLREPSSPDAAAPESPGARSGAVEEDGRREAAERSPSAAERREEAELRALRSEPAPTASEKSAAAMEEARAMAAEATDPALPISRRLEAFAALAQLDGDDDWNADEHGTARTDAVVDSMLELVRDHPLDAELRVEVLGDLAGLRSPKLGVEALAYLETSADARTREEAAEILGSFAGEARTSAMLEALARVAELDPSEAVRKQALESLERIGD